MLKIYLNKITFQGNPRLLILIATNVCFEDNVSNTRLFSEYVVRALKEMALNKRNDVVINLFILENTVSGKQHKFL